MLPLLEMLMKSQNGDAFSLMQKKFGLSAAETEKALEAVLPAFSTGLKRNAAKPQDFGAFMQSLSGGRHEKYIDDTAAPFTAKGKKDGNGILGYLFGSKDVSRAVANQAAKTSGVDAGIIKKMLPAVASMIMGGLFKQSTGQAQYFGDSGGRGGASGGGGILGQILGELMKGGGGQQRQQRQPRGRKSNPIGDILEQMMGGGNRGTGRQTNSPYGGGNNPLGKIFEDMLSGGRGQYKSPNEVGERARFPGPTTRRQPRQPRQPDFSQNDGGFEDFGTDRPRRKPAPQRRPTPRQQNPQGRGGGFEDLFGDMFETGRKVDNGYQRNIESIFDKYMKR